MNFRNTPLQIGTDKDWTTISAGEKHTIALKKDGSLWAWGWNYYGQIGDGTNTNPNTPLQIGTDKDWTTISAGGEHTIALKKDGSLWAWGYNSYGQIGDGTGGWGNNRNAPVRIGTDEDWSVISAGGEHTIALKKDGSLWAWGYNEYGQLGDGTNRNRDKPIQIETGEIIPGDSIPAVAAGVYYSIALKKDGSLWAWGWNYFGQLGNGTNTDRGAPILIGRATDWSAISAGTYHTIALKKDGSLWAWGTFGYGAVLDDGTFSDGYSPVQIGTDKDWLAVSAGNYHAIALKKDGSLWAWGSNSYGQLGDGTNTAGSTPVQIGIDEDWSAISAGADHTIALKKDGSLWAWGNNESGQLGVGTDEYYPNTPLQIGTDKDWTTISAGGYNTIALKKDGSLWAWGSPWLLGDGTTTGRQDTPLQIGLDKDWSAISTGQAHALALKKDGSLWAWGRNYIGQLGDGTLTDRDTPVRIGTEKDWSAISAGHDHTIALKKDDSVWVWGGNDSGQLGYGALYSSVPAQPAFPVYTREFDDGEDGFFALSYDKPSWESFSPDISWGFVARVRKGAWIQGARSEGDEGI